MNALLKNILNKKTAIIMILAISWLSLLWINFYGDLSIAMHFIAIPLLLVITGGFSAYTIEQMSYNIENKTIKTTAFK